MQKDRTVNNPAAAARSIESPAPQLEQESLFPSKRLPDAAPLSDEALPRTAKLLRDDSVIVRRCYSRDLARSEASFRLIAPQLRESLLLETDNIVINNLLSVAAQMGRGASTLLPSLTPLLTSNHQATRVRTLEILGRLGQSAISAVPALVITANRLSGQEKDFAIAALNRIDSGALAGYDYLMEYVSRNREINFLGLSAADYFVVLQLCKPARVRSKGASCLVEALGSYPRKDPHGYLTHMTFVLTSGHPDDQALKAPLVQLLPAIRIGGKPLALLLRRMSSNESFSEDLRVSSAASAVMLDPHSPALQDYTLQLLQNYFRSGDADQKRFAVIQAKRILPVLSAGSTQEMIESLSSLMDSASPPLKDLIIRTFGKVSHRADLVLACLAPLVIRGSKAAGGHTVSSIETITELAHILPCTAQDRAKALMNYAQGENDPALKAKAEAAFKRIKMAQASGLFGPD